MEESNENPSIGILLRKGKDSKSFTLTKVKLTVNLDVQMTKRKISLTELGQIELLEFLSI